MAFTIRRLARRVRRLEKQHGRPITAYGGGPGKRPGVNVAAFHDAAADGDDVYLPGVDGEMITYLFDEPLQVRDRDGFRFSGPTRGPQRYSVRAKLTEAANDAPVFLDFQGGRGVDLRGICPVAGADFRGWLVDISGSALRESKMNTVRDAFVGGVGAKEDEPMLGGIRATKGHGHLLDNLVIGKTALGLQGREVGSYSNRVAVRRVVFWENVVHVADGGDGWLFDSVGFQQGWGEGRPDAAFRMAPDHADPLSGVSWVGIWHGDIDRGIGFDLAGDVASMSFKGQFSAYAGPDTEPTLHTTIKASGRLADLDLRGAYFKGRTERSVALDLIDCKTANPVWTHGSYGFAGDWWYLPRPVLLPGDVPASV